MLLELTVIDRSENERGQLQLQKRGDDYEIISNGTFLMATYNGESERSLVSVPVSLCEQPRHVLIGGLGVGFSLREALRHEQLERVTVVEIEEKIIEWNATHLAPFSDHALQNPRAHVVLADLLSFIHVTEETYDCICLDIDNGPDWTVTENNGNLYGEDNLLVLSRLLNDGGVIAFWSASDSPEFARRMELYFDQVDVLTYEVERGEPDVVFIGRKR